MSKLIRTESHRKWTRARDDNIIERLEVEIDIACKQNDTREAWERQDN